MKLRLRNYESKQTQRIQVQSPCSLQQLQDTLFLSLPPPHLPLRFSLNAKDLLLSPSPHASLQSLGVAAGDLIYFSANPNAFSALPSTQESQPTTPIEQPNQMPESSNDQQPTPFQQSSQSHEPMSEEEPGFSRENQGTESMDVDSLALTERLSEPYFLRKVLREEVGDNGSIHKLLAISVHAVLLESGFVGFDPVSGLQTDRFHVPDECPSPFSLCYSLPELLRDGCNLTDYIVLKFNTLGQFVQVYGSLVEGSGLHRLSLDEVRFAPALNLVWANCDKNDDNGGSINSYPEKEVFEFWKIVKDGLALPLLIDLCYKTGLALPACLIRLPSELKLKIIESLPSADLARMECVCSEMRYLASNNDLWKNKFEQEFGGMPGGSTVTNWKKMFVSKWKERNQAVMMLREIPSYFRRRDPNPFRPPRIIGGNYDLAPVGLRRVFGSPVLGPHPFVPRPHTLSFQRFQGRRSFGPPCNLGEGQDDAQ